jgi:hypothetical protein
MVGPASAESSRGLGFPTTAGERAGCPNVFQRRAW